MPTTAAALAGAEAAFAGPIADIEGKIAGAASATASVAIQPPSVDLAAALKVAATLPGVSVSVEGLLSLSAALGIELGALKIALGLVLAVSGNLGARVRFIATEGTEPQMGSDIMGAIGSDPTADGIAVALVAEESGSVAALRSLFGLG